MKTIDVANTTSFFSPDPFERNLGQFRQKPNEGHLFYGLIQNGTDTWNASFFVVRAQLSVDLLWMRWVALQSKQ